MKARVIHVITKLELGGAQQNTLYTVERLDRSRFCVALWSGPGGILTEDARGVADLDFELVPDLVREVRPGRDFRALRTLAAMLRREVASGAPVIVHTHSSKAGILGRWAAWLAKVPHVVHTFHGFGFNDYQKLPVKGAFIAAEILTGRVTDAFVAVSRANLGRAVALKIAPAENIRLIRSGIDLHQFEEKPIDKAAVKQSIGVDPASPLALMVACMKPQKNPVDFIRAAALVADRVPEARFAVAGDGELRPAMEQAIRDQGLEDKVRLLGWRRDVPELLWSSDVLALTSLWEGLPRVYPQAMAAGVPIVGTRVDGAAEAVRDGLNGWLVPPGDVNGLADYIVELLKDPATARAYGQAGKELAAEFDIDLMVRQQEELYEELLTRSDLT